MLLKHKMDWKDDSIKQDYARTNNNSTKINEHPAHTLFHLNKKVTP